MTEFKSPDIAENKRPEIENYKNIKPENGMTKGEALRFWDKVFGKETEEGGKEVNSFDVDKSTNADGMSEEDKAEKKGGSYKEVYKEGEGDKCEIHHMPSDAASNLERNEGPCIKMEKDDHRQTASCGASKEACEYRAAQKSLIEQGKFREALQMDIDDIHEKFGDKYDGAIAEMLEYVDKLEMELPV